jgi:hypothetical protein
VGVVNLGGLPKIDLGYGKLEPFDPGWVQT